MKEPHSEEVKIKDGFFGQRMIVLPKKVINNVENSPLISSLYLTDIGYFPRAKHHFRERKTGGKEYILIYCIDGNGVIQIYDHKQIITPNTFYIIPPDTPHKYQAIEKEPWSIYWVHFRGICALHLYQKFCINQVPAIKSAPFDEKRIALFDRIIDLLEEGFSNDYLEFVNVSLWQLFSSFIFHDFTKEVEKSSNNGDVIASSIMYMKNHLEKDLNVGEIAGNINYSVSHFCFLFKKSTGYSPIQYFNQLKIQKSCQYLSFTGLSIKELSYKLGIEDPFYFSRLFKKAMGISPLKYRNKYRE